MAQNPHHSRLKCAASPTRPVQGQLVRKTRPTPPLQQHFRERIRPARHKTPILSHLSHAGRTFSRSHPPSDRAGRTFSRTGHSHVATMQPMTPLRPLMQASAKPPSPMLAPNKGPLKPTSPLHPKTAPKPPISHPQRRWRFQLRLDLRPQRRWRFQTARPPGRQGLAPAPVGGGGAWPRRAEPHISDQAPQVWRAPEGPEGTGGLRGAAPNEVRLPSLAGGRALRRAQHPWGHKQHRTHIQKRPPGTGWAYLSRLWESNPRPIHYE